MKQIIELDNKKWNDQINRFASRIPGKPLVKKIMDWHVGLPEDCIPSKEYVKEYIKVWLS